MSCNDILEKLEKEGIISAEGVIDSFEPLRSRKKMATIRKSDK